jgi:hypothetical protein
MQVVKHENFNWERLLSVIKGGTVIPVIGQGLYRVEVKGWGEGFLYDYLAKKILKKFHGTIEPKENHKFSKACLEYLKKYKDAYFDLSEDLKKELDGLSLKTDETLLKLARIRNFNVFINTAYDGFLTNAIKRVRLIEPQVLYYSLGGAGLSLNESDLSGVRNDSECPLVYHIFGSVEKKQSVPAYTEGDIIEAIVGFQNNKENDRHFSSKLKGRSLLFINCSYDDWLFRFFLRALFEKSPGGGYSNFQNYNFVGDNFESNIRDPFQELPRFLNDQESEVFYSSDGSAFVDMLFQKVYDNDKDNDEIIPLSDSLGSVFISFEGRDRPAAVQLADSLKKMGIKVWLDDKKINPGDHIDKKIVKAIQSCQFFLPLISRNSKLYIDDKEKLKYHVQEWHCAWAYKEDGKNIIIIPIIIEDTEDKDEIKRLQFDKFDRYAYLKIPNGICRGQGYEKLIAKLNDTLKEKL